MHGHAAMFCNPGFESCMDGNIAT